MRGIQQRKQMSGAAFGVSGLGQCVQAGDRVYRNIMCQRQTLGDSQSDAQAGKAAGSTADHQTVQIGKPDPGLIQKLASPRQYPLGMRTRLDSQPLTHLAVKRRGPPNNTRSNFQSPI